MLILERVGICSLLAWSCGNFNRAWPAYLFRTRSVFMFLWSDYNTYTWQLLSNIITYEGTKASLAYENEYIEVTLEVLPLNFNTRVWWCRKGDPRLTFSLLLELRLELLVKLLLELGSGESLPCISPESQRPSKLQSTINAISTFVKSFIKNTTPLSHTNALNKSSRADV